MAGHDGLRLVDVGVVRHGFVRSACHLGHFEVNLIRYQLTLLPLHRSALFDWWVYLKKSQFMYRFYLSNLVIKVGYNLFAKGIKLEVGVATLLRNIPAKKIVQGDDCADGPLL